MIHQNGFVILWLFDVDIFVKSYDIISLINVYVMKCLLQVRGDGEFGDWGVSSWHVYPEFAQQFKDDI